VLEQMREAAPAFALVLRAHVEPLVDVHERQLAVDVKDDLQPVRKRVLLELDLRNGRGCLLRRRRPGLRHARLHERGGGQRKGQKTQRGEPNVHARTSSMNGGKAESVARSGGPGLHTDTKNNTGARSSRGRTEETSELVGSGGYAMLGWLAGC